MGSKRSLLTRFNLTVGVGFLTAVSIIGAFNIREGRTFTNDLSRIGENGCVDGGRMWSGNPDDLWETVPVARCPDWEFPWIEWGWATATAALISLAGSALILIWAPRQNPDEQAS